MSRGRGTRQWRTCSAGHRWYGRGDTCEQCAKAKTSARPRALTREQMERRLGFRDE